MANGTTVRHNSPSSTIFVSFAQKESVSLAGFETKSVEIGIANTTGAPITIPAGSTLYVTVVSTSVNSDTGRKSARCTDPRVYTPSAESAEVAAVAAEAPF